MIMITITTHPKTMTQSLISEIKETLNKYGAKPKKSLGQNFLINPSIYKKIIELSNIERGDTVIEVGPGPGTLTKYLIEAGADIVAIEKDRTFVEILKNNFTNRSIDIKEEDILNYIPSIREGSYSLLGNIPYYLTSRLFRNVFEKWPSPKKIIFLIQKEVADRINSAPPEMSLLSLSVQFFSEIEKIVKVEKENFWPQPKVESAIIVLAPKKIKESQDFIEQFFELAHAGFSQKRKQLINNLSKSLEKTKDEISQILEKADIDPTRRAETLSIEEWKKLTKIYFSL